MSRRILMLFAFAILSPGCVPVTEPVGDIDKAEPNKDLIGTWKDKETTPRPWVVDRPEVKGNPKGLMRVRIVEPGQKLEDIKVLNAFWFFTATVGKHTYVNVLVVDSGPDGGKPELIDFSKEGVYARWTEHMDRGYNVAHVEIKGAVATLDFGNKKAFDALMSMNKFQGGRSVFRTPSDWLTKYLKENGPKEIFTKDKEGLLWTLTKEKRK